MQRQLAPARGQHRRGDQQCRQRQSQRELARGPRPRRQRRDREQEQQEAVERAAFAAPAGVDVPPALRSEEHTSELQSLMRISYAVFCLKKKTKADNKPTLA